MLPGPLFSIYQRYKQDTNFVASWLAVYEPSQAFLDAPAIERPVPETKDAVIYEAEPQTSPEELLFAFVLLMNDLNKIRSNIKWIWLNHRDGTIDLAASAVATNTALEFGHGLIDELDPLLKAFEGGTWKLSNNFHALLCLYKGIDCENAFREISDESYKIADESWVLTYRMLKELLPTINPQGHAPLYKEGTYGIYDPCSDRATKTGQQKCQEDEILIREIFTELMIVVRHVPDYPVTDEFLRAMKDMWKTLEVPFYGAMAAQVFLDIHHILRGSIYNSRQTMINQTSIMANDLRRQLEFHKNLKNDNWPASNDHMILLKQQLIEWIGRDPVFRAKSKLYSKITGQEIDKTSAHRLILYCPVISGLILFRLRAEIHEIGIAVANSWGSITYPAHLYNALQHEKLLSPGHWWKDMDMVLDLLGDSHFWVGEGEFIRPSTPDEYFSRFNIQMGVTAAVFTNPKKARKTNKVNLHSRAGPRGIDDRHAAVTSMFADRYCNLDAAQVEWTPEHVENILAYSGFEINFSLDKPTWSVEQIDDPIKLREKRAKAAKNMKGKGKAVVLEDRGEGVPRRVAPTDLIRAIAMSLTAEVLEVGFPYLVLHRMSWKLLRAVK